MRALWPWIRCEARRRLPALVALAVLVALAGGFVLACASGARRTDTAWERLVSQSDPPTVFAQAKGDDYEGAVSWLRSQPGVEAAGAMVLAFAQPASFPPGSANAFVALDDELGHSVLRPLVLDGRLADPARADEATVNEVMAEQGGIEVGDTVDLASQYDIPRFQQSVTVVGITRTALDVTQLVGVPFLTLTPAYWERWGPAVIDAAQGPHNLDPILMARTASGVDPAPIATALGDATGVFGVPADVAADPTVLRSTSVIALSLVAMAIAAALATIGVLGLAAQRVVRSSSQEQHVLAALGAGSRERRLAALLPAGAAVAVGAVAALPTGWLASGAVVRGFARTVDPTHGRSLHLPLAALVVLVLVVVVLGLASVGTRGSAAAGRATGVLRRAGRPSPAIGLGTALGIGPATARGGRATVLGVVVGVAGLIGCVVFAASLNALVERPIRGGWSFDASMEVNDEADPQAAVAAADADAAVLGLAVSRLSSQLVGADSPSTLMSFEPRRGDVRPPLTSGEWPSAPDEVLLGPAIARDLGVSTGDGTEVNGVPFRVSGIVVVPELGDSSFGSTAIVTPAGFERAAGPDAEARMDLLVRVAPGTDLDELAARLGTGGDVIRPYLPTELVNLQRVQDSPFLLEVFFGLLAVAALAFGLATSQRMRRRDVAVLRSMGLTRRQVRGAVRWEGLGLALAGILVGIPAGVVLGRLTWRFVSGDVTGLTTPEWALPALALTVVALLALALVASAWPQLAASRLRPAEVLRDE